MAHGSKLSLEKAAMIRRLSAEGISSRKIAQAFGCSESMVRHILHDRAWVHHLCDGCRRPISGQRTSGYCERCKKQFCCHCGQAKPAERKSERCVLCDRAHWRQHLESRARVCRECGEELPETRRDVLCTECRSESQQFHARFRVKRAKEQGIVCKVEGCEALVPALKSWTRNMCREHAKEHDRRRRSLSRRQCGICGKLLSDMEVGLCKPCRAIDARIRRRGLPTGPPEVK